VAEATCVQPCGQVAWLSGWQLPVVGSQHTAGCTHGLVGWHTVPAGCTVPPWCTHTLGSMMKHRPQQQHTSTGWLHTGLGLHGVCPRKIPPSPLHIVCEVVAHPPGRQHAPNCAAELHDVGVHAVPTPWYSPPMIAHWQGSSGEQMPLGWQHAPKAHGPPAGGHGFGWHVAEATCVQPCGQVAWLSA
jgi:hypothetical protein